MKLPMDKRVWEEKRCKSENGRNNLMSLLLISFEHEERDKKKVVRRGENFINQAISEWMWSKGSETLVILSFTLMAVKRRRRRTMKMSKSCDNTL